MNDLSIDLDTIAERRENGHEWVDAKESTHRQWILEQLDKATEYAKRPDAKYYTWAESRAIIMAKHGI
jgi:hypothetical protein